MDILYITLPEPSNSVLSARQSLNARIKGIPSATLNEIMLSEYADIYRQHSHYSFDLIIAECQINTFNDDIQKYANKLNAIFVGDREVWGDIAKESATAALLYTAPGRASIIFLYGDGPIPQKVIDRTLPYTHVTFKSCDEVTKPDFIELLVYRVESGLAPLPLLQHMNVISFAGVVTAQKIPTLISQVLADTFENDDINRWIFSFCYRQYAGDFQAARTLCLVVRYARIVTSEQLEGIPLQFQCAIVPKNWWEENHSNFKSILQFRDSKKPRMSITEAAYLRKLIHFSDGYSTLFVITADGQFQALVEGGVNDQYTRHRLDNLVEKFNGFVVTTDLRRQIWIHGQHMSSPIILMGNQWGIDPSNRAVSILSSSLKRRGMPSERLARMVEIIRYLSDEHIGGFFIFHHEPQEVARQLNTTQLREDIRIHFELPITIDTMSLPSIVRFLSLDGAQIIDYTGNIHLLCQQLNPPTTTKDIGPPGTKHATAEKVALRLRDAVVAVISHDGPVTVFADEIKATSEGLEPY
ncbi:MAG: hypothetical protein AMJ88_11375 [Anaerolineae bacterium SM23_ 63]|nr:MAG: hypothetical protein AMJ88_11375 [Anaerolineae bacterium SM23_ 63]HEY47612.1 hypothetical protein [Anaerolineae bacterium]